MIAFIDDHRQAYGVEPICKILPIAPSTYHAHVAKRVDPGRLSPRAKRDLSLKVQIRRVFAENFEAYGVRKVWRQLRREGASVPSHGGEAVGSDGLARRDPRLASGHGAALSLIIVRTDLPRITPRKPI